MHSVLSHLETGCLILQKATGAALPSAAWLRAQAGQQDSPAGVSAIDSIAIDAALGGPRIAASQMQPMFCMSPVKAPQSAHISAISSNLRHSSTLPLGKLETVAEEGTGESGYVMDQSLVRLAYSPDQLGFRF